MLSKFILSSQINKDHIGNKISVRGRLLHKEFSSDKELIYFYIRDDTGLLTILLKNSDFPDANEIPLETFILISGLVKDQKQPSITQFVIKAIYYELLSNPSDDIEPFRNVLSSIRFLYIRKLEIKTLLVIKRLIRKYAITYLEDQGYQAVETPVITSFTQINRQALRITTNRKNDITEREKYLIQKSGFYLEAFAHTFGKVFTLTPAFRADHRESNYNLAEFWLLEVEEIFSDISEKMSLLESLIQYISSKLLEDHVEDLRNLIIYRELSKFDDKALIIHELDNAFWNKIGSLQKQQLIFLKKIIQRKPFPRLEYKNVIKDFESNGDFTKAMHLGEKRGTKLTTKYDGPVFITHFPFELRHFYDKKCLEDPVYTCTFDLLGHGNFGEISSGNEGEYRAALLDEQMQEKKLRKENNQTLQWYYKLQSFGSVPHAGFSIGLERFTSWLTQTESITDTIGFPRRVIGHDINY